MIKESDYSVPWLIVLTVCSIYVIKQVRFNNKRINELYELDVEHRIKDRSINY